MRKMKSMMSYALSHICGTQHYIYLGKNKPSLKSHENWGGGGGGGVAKAECNVVCHMQDEVHDIMHFRNNIFLKVLVTLSSHDASVRPGLSH